MSQFSRLIEEVTGDNFDVEFDIIDPLHGKQSKTHTYEIKVN